MKQNQENKLTMYDVVNAYLVTNALIVALRPALVTAQTAFAAIISAIRAADQVKQVPITGMTVDKGAAKQTLADSVFTVAQGVMAYANDNSNATLFEQVNYSVSDLLRLSDEILPQVAQNIHDAANTNIVAIADYGILPADLTDLLAKRQAYLDSIPKHTNATAGKKTKTGSLSQLFKDGDKLLKKTMDRIVRTLKSSNPDFVADYFNARVIYDLGAQHHEVLLETDLTIAAGAVVPIDTSGFTIQPTYTIEFDNTGAVLLREYFSSPDNPAGIVTKSINAGDTLTQSVSDLGFDEGETLKVQNPGAAEGHFHLVVRS